MPKRKNFTLRPWDAKEFHAPALAQLNRAIRHQQNRVQQTTGEEQAHHQKALTQLAEEWHKHTGEKHVR